MLRFASLVVALVLLVLVNDTASHSASGPHIADVNILLPPKMTHPVEYRLQGSDGCFKWSWDHHDILSVLPEYNLSSHCSTSARLMSIAPYSGRKETAVYATDVRTGMVIRCKVYIDNFSRIQIFHNSIKLDLDGLSTLRVRAFDNEENVFSSLVGLQFMWELVPETNGLPHHLAHVPLKDSPLSDCGGLCGDLDIQIRLEDSGVFSDLYVVKGSRIGHEIVSAHLLEPQFKPMADKIVLTVAEAMSLDPPSPVFVLIGATVRYSLKVIRGNIPQVVPLPSPFHRWSVLNSSVAQVDAKMGLAYALSLGVTIITVEDTRVVGHMQMSSLHVVLPDTLCLYILPLSLFGDPVEGIEPIPSVSRWYLVSGKQYLIHVKVFSQGPDAQEIYTTESDDVILHDNQSKYWNTFRVSDSIAVKHRWWNSRILKATSCGLGKLTATLSYSSGHHEAKEVLKVVQEVMVCNQVMFSMDKRTDVSRSILLPWAPAVYQEVELKATGGCAKALSDYKWFSSDMATVSVSASGVVQAKKPGKATIKVVSIFDPLNYDEVVVEVSIPSSIVMLPNFPVETVVGSHLQAAVTMKASNGAYFYRCDAFSSSIRWKAGSESFAIVNATVESFVLDKLCGPPCAWTCVFASSAGHTILHATLSKDYQQLDHSLSGPIVLKASLRIAAYSPLIVHQAGDGNQFGGCWFNLTQAEAQNQLVNLDNLYLVPGTHLDVMLCGGPDRWDQGVDFIGTVESLDEEHTDLKDGVLVHQISTSYGTPYRILCQTLGTFKLVFKRGNLVGDDHPLPVVAEVELSLTCAFPSAIVLIADEPVNAPDAIWSASQADRDPRRMRATPITVANGRTIRISAVSISNTGKAFGNSSSLCLRWELSNCDGLASWDDAYELSSKSSWERFLVLQNASGLCIVRATVLGFCDTSSGYHFTAPSESLESVLTDAISLQLVSTLRVNPEFGLLFFSPDAQLNLSITGGSCFVDAVVNNSQVVEVIPPPPGLQCSQLVLAPKGLGTALVTVYDIGVAPPLAASSVVQVADIDWIKITSREEISLVEGTLQSINLLAGVNDGSTFGSSQYIYMNICVHIEDHIVELVDRDDLPSPIDRYLKMPSFVIRARHLGVTTLYVSARQQSGHEILSQPIKVEVYAPPRIYPSDIFLVPGASYVLTVRGGPTIGSYVEYASMDDMTATIDKSLGRLSAISPGNTTLVATVYGNGDTIICQAYGRVKVGIPSSVVLNVQSDQLAVGREMPIFPSFSEGNLFSFYELCKNYKWSIEDEKVLSFQEHLRGDKYGVPIAGQKDIKSTSYFDEEDLDFIKVLYGRSTGRTDVAVLFSCDFVSSGSFLQSRSYNASISLWVVSDLPLALGAPITWILPPYYTTSNLLPSSSNSYSQRDTQSRKGTITYSLLRECGGKNEEVQKDAISIDGGRIKTMESNNLACIQAKDRSTGRTEVASCVRVAEVSQIRITTKEFPFHMINVAVGAELDLTINYCDVLGNPFHEAYNSILFDAETNYPDVVSINDTRDGNGNIHLKAMRHGRALVRILFSSNPQKSDYMMISVGAHLYPQNPVLHIGSHLNFSMEGLNDQVFGCWLSANGSVISIDMLTGKAEALGEGTTQVIFEGSGLKLQTAVTVLKGNIVFVDAPEETLTNIPFPAKGYRFSVKFSDAYYHKYEALGNGVEVLYDCRVDPPFVGYAKPWRDLDTGNSYCLFFPYSPEHLVRYIPKSKDMRQDISVSINASLREANHISGSASALFIGGFSILEIDKNLLQLNLTSDSKMSIITIVGNTDVEIHWHDRDKLMISPIHKEDLGIGGRAQYEVKVLGAQRFKEKVIMTLPANGQRVEIDVIYEPGDRTTSATTTKVTLWAGIFGCFSLLILTVAVFICFLDRPERSQPTNPPATPTVTAPVTPNRSSPAAVVSEQSPRTPQPFIEYVRRTIDETPYYKREGRRRFNPQNTF
uniref:BIG2 domain-containing protein n=1 Tax=Davidia involucrata TaxID=16924 RepID=A0A5B7BTW7_DAVIN